MLFTPVPILFKAAAAATTTWDPSNTDANITLSGGNLTATRGAGSAGADVYTRSVASHSSGKYYAEFTITVAGGAGTEFIGVGNSSASAGSFLGANNNGIGYLDDGRVFLNGSNTGTIASYTTADVVCLAIDRDNNKFWARKNGGNWNNTTDDPATNTGGRDISAITGDIFVYWDAENNGEIAAANFGGSAYAQTAPSGFGNW